MSQGSSGSPRRPRYADAVVHSANGRISTSSPISASCRATHWAQPIIPGKSGT